MEFLNSIGDTGFVLVLFAAAVGSAFGTMAAGMGALGAWKKCYQQNKTAPFILVTFVGAPLSQTIYGMILMNALIAAPSTVSGIVKLTVGLAGGIAMGLSAWLQGRAGAMASDALAETQKGFGNYMMVLGIIETVALFVMVFLMTGLK